MILLRDNIVKLWNSVQSWRLTTRNDSFILVTYNLQFRETRKYFLYEKLTQIRKYQIN